MDIPKIIHYCWFGYNKKSDKIFNCMETWHEFLSDYKIIEWNENNCDINSSNYASRAYNKKKWAYVADYFRFKILYEYGGIYLDTDMQINKNLDNFLLYDAFFAMECYEWVNGGIIGAKPRSNVIQKIFNNYENNKYQSFDGTICHRITRVLIDDYFLKQTGDTQILNDNIAVFSPNILTINIDDGKNYCEHIYDNNISWLNNNNKVFAEGETWKYTVLQRYFYNLYKKTEITTDKSSFILSYEIKNMLLYYSAKRLLWQIIKEYFRHILPNWLLRIYKCNKLV